ncbi:MAG: hypothetical protein Q9166_002096 [cf. Caloplaca sp. 2 TL-2023]
MVVVSGDWPNYSISAWELTADRQWNNTSGSKTGPIPLTSNKEYAEVAKDIKDKMYRAYNIKPRLCALIPNEVPKGAEVMTNGLNVVVVTTFDYYWNQIYYGNYIHFRVYVKDGEAIPTETKPANPQPPAGKGGNTGERRDPATPAPVGWKITGEIGIRGVVSDVFPETVWVGIIPTSAMVPASCFIPPSGYWSTTQDMKVTKCQNTEGRGGQVIIQPNTTLPVPPPMRWNPSYTFETIFKPDTERDQLGNWECIDRTDDIGESLFKIKSVVAEVEKDGSGRDIFSFYAKQGVKLLKSDGKTVVQHYIDDGYATGSSAPIDAEYYYGTYQSASPRAIAVLYKRWDNDRVWIRNPETIFKALAGRPKPGSAPNANQPLTLPFQPSINPIPTVADKPKPQNRPVAGWKEYYDCIIEDKFAYNKHFYKMGWRLCKVGSTIRGIPMYGIMNLFSFHGVLGCRIYAPREPGQYHAWVNRGMNPYMGQTSLGKLSNTRGLAMNRHHAAMTNMRGNRNRIQQLRSMERQRCALELGRDGRFRGFECLEQ